MIRPYYNNNLEPASLGVLPQSLPRFLLPVSARRNTCLLVGNRLIIPAFSPFAPEGSRKLLMRKTVSGIAVVFALAAVTLWGETPEAIVRQTYAKVTFASQVWTIEKAVVYTGSKKPASDVTPLLAANQLTFELSNFKTGAIDRNSAPLTSLITDFSGKPILNLIFMLNKYKEADIESREITAAVHSDTGPTDGTSNMEGYEVSDLATPAYDGAPHWSRYVGYEVTAAYQGKKTSYHAAFIIADDGTINARDPFLNNLTSFIAASVYPTVLLKRGVTNESVRAWVKANTSDTAKPGELSCSDRCLLPSGSLSPQPQRAPLLHSLGE